MSITKCPGHMRSLKLNFSATVLTLGLKAKIWSELHASPHIHIWIGIPIYGYIWIRLYEKMLYMWASMKFLPKIFENLRLCKRKFWGELRTRPPFTRVRV